MVQCRECQSVCDYDFGDWDNEDFICADCLSESREIVEQSEGEPDDDNT